MRVPGQWFTPDTMSGMTPQPDRSLPDVDPKCNGCNACCWHELVHVLDHETGYHTKSMISPINGAMIRVLRHNDDGSCVYLKDGKCSIYEYRPQCCRQFNCGGWYRVMLARAPAKLKMMQRESGHVKKLVKQGRARS